jgi:nucleoid DNA-binding protein
MKDHLLLITALPSGTETIQNRLLFFRVREPCELTLTKAHMIDRLLEQKLVHSRLEASFMIVDKRERNGRDPQTGKAIRITARRIVKYRPSTALKVEMNEHIDRARQSEREHIGGEIGSW